MKNSSSKKKNVLAIFLILAIIIGGCITAIGFYAKTVINEGTVELEKEQKPSITPVPNESEFTDYLNKLIAYSADSSKVKTKLETNLSLDVDSIKTDASDADAKVMGFALENMLGELTERYESYDGSFGDGFKAVPTVLLSEDEITDLHFRQGQTEKDNDETKYEDSYYYFTADICVTGLNEAVPENICTTFKTDETEKIIDGKYPELSEMLDVVSREIKVENCRIEGKTNRFKDQLQSLAFMTEYSLSFELDFKGDYAELGRKTLSFNYTVEKNYSYTWAGLDIDEETIIIKQGEEEQLTVNAVVADDAESDDFKLTVRSSDESVAVIDKDGVVKGVKVSDKPVTVTIALEYLGNVYTDECEVYVVVPVEKVKTQPESLSLCVNDSKQLTCNIMPENATIKDVLWFTEDESTATVTEDGIVTAVRSGTVKVYAVSVDGHFRSSCTVEVK